MSLDTTSTESGATTPIAARRGSQRARRAATAVLWVFVAFVFAIGAFVCFIMWQNMPRRWDEGRLEISKVRGAAIVSQIRSFKATQSRWPMELRELPEPIEAPVCGLKRWEFHAESDWFVLKAPGAPIGYPSLYFDSREGRWMVDD